MHTVSRLERRRSDGFESEAGFLLGQVSAWRDLIQNIHPLLKNFHFEKYQTNN